MKRKSFEIDSFTVENTSPAYGPKYTWKISKKKNVLEMRDN